MTKRKAPEDNRQGQGGGVSPRILTDAEIEQIEKLAAYLTVEQVADFIGVARRTFYDIMERQPEVAARYKSGRAKVIGVLAQSLISKARDGDTSSLIFYLKTQAGWREKTEIDHVSSDNSMSPVPSIVVTSAELKDMLKKLNDEC